MSTDTWIHLIALVCTAIGATWALRTKLGDLEIAMKTHVTQDTEKFHSLDERVTVLEKRRRR